MIIELTQAEAEAIFEVLNSLSGGSPENVFAWDGTDDKKDPTTSAMIKIFRAAGQRVPE